MMVVGSFSNMGTILHFPPPMWPANPTLENYRRVLNNGTVRAMFNTAWMGCLAIALTITVNGAAAYYFSIFDRHEWLYRVFLVSMLLPPATLFIPLFVTLTRFYHAPEWAAVIAPGIFSVANIMIMRIYFDSIPREIVECARLDGSGEGRIFAQFVLPLCRPIVALIAFGAFAVFLGNGLWQQLIIQDTRLETLLVNIYRRIHTGVGANQFNPLGRNMAMGTILMVPALAVFLASSKYVTSLKLRIEMGEK